jgi:hypothetical protein
MRTRSDTPKFSERLVVPAPVALVEAVERGAAAKLQGRSEYVRQSLLRSLEADGVRVESSE